MLVISRKPEKEMERRRRRENDLFDPF